MTAQFAHGRAIECWCKYSDTFSIHALGSEGCFAESYFGGK